MAFRERLANKIKNYNTKEWTFSCVASLYENPGSSKEQKPENVLQLTTDGIGKTVIYNSIESFVPTIQMTYMDNEFELGKIFNNNRFYLHIFLTGEDMDRTSKTPADLTLTFIINDLNIVEKTASYVLYELKGAMVSDLYFSLNVCVTHDKAELVSPYDMITAAMSKAQLMLDPDYTDTEKRISFISPQAWTVKDIIRYCLEVAVGKKSPPSYFFTRLHDRVSMLWNQFTKSPIAVNAFNMSLQVVTNEISTGNRPKMLDLVSDISSDTLQGGANNLRLLSTRIFNHFNHDKREWTQTIYNNTDMINLIQSLSSKENKILHEVFFNIEDIGKVPLFKNELKLSYPNWSEHKIYSILRNLELCSDNIHFTVRWTFK